MWIWARWQWSEVWVQDSPRRAPPPAPPRPTRLPFNQRMIVIIVSMAPALSAGLKTSLIPRFSQHLPSLSKIITMPTSCSCLGRTQRDPEGPRWTVALEGKSWAIIGFTNCHRGWGLWQSNAKSDEIMMMECAVEQTFWILHWQCWSVRVHPASQAALAAPPLHHRTSARQSQVGIWNFKW